MYTCVIKTQHIVSSNSILRPRDTRLASSTGKLSPLLETITPWQTISPESPGPSPLVAMTTGSNPNLWPSSSLE
ncbi:hypothetical protein FR483_n698L [Paramecium bursaria Chlorella virus FR483]|uniref:Uncharacterized protein n698L n=1 Tax=Paramecium bursaria Chlorella virus FR483 TaxID=399781 RepID=A7J852_PBCVF|nr:hypothetical protein FR483_n698L [Paramecium bursaria Chlorella virus FR483]ABT15983.1 hypothetical protein FR483_n698L [Paramecium bursaria Chlorella virus FR483]